MRSLGDAAFLNDYIGIPYKFGGREWDGVDCYGLVKLVYKEEYGILLPDWLTDRLDIRDRTRRIQDQVCSGTWEDVDDPEDGDFVVCYRHRAAHHLGLHFAGGILHSADGLGVMYEPRGRFEPQYREVKYGKWTP